MLSQAKRGASDKLTYTPDQLLKLIHDTGAFSAWDRNKGPVFWYIAGVPGPFYVNTELLIGKELAKNLLAQIDIILAEIPGSDPAARAAKIESLILPAYEKEPVYKNLIAAMVTRAEKEFPL